jgi:hypothetical protein
MVLMNWWCLLLYIFLGCLLGRLRAKCKKIIWHCILIPFNFVFIIYEINFLMLNWTNYTRQACMICPFNKYMEIIYLDIIWHVSSI